MPQIFPNHEEQLQRLSRIEGQVRGIRKMIEERRYCVDIALQIKAVHSALSKVKMGVLEKHVHHCVKAAAASGDDVELDGKITEIVKLLGEIK